MRLFFIGAAFALKGSVFFTLDFCFLIHLHKTNRFGTSFVSLAGTCVCVSAGESGSYLQGNPTLLNSESVCGCRKCEDHSVWATWRAPTQYCSSRLQTGTHRLPVHWSKSNEPPHISFRISNAHVSAHLGFLQKLNIFSHKIKKHSLHSQNLKKKVSDLCKDVFENGVFTSKLLSSKHWNIDTSVLTICTLQ